LEDQQRVRVVDEFLRLTEKIPFVDVRTPSEFSKGHIPGAINIPLFSDEERSVVGTVYKREGEREAVLKGLSFVGPKMTAMLDRGIDLAGNKRQLGVYCWRGGRRSASMAWLFSQGDIKCSLLAGGYKNYRTHVLDEFGKERNIIIVGGMTGSGKTEILKEIDLMGEQVIDLEGIANHRGSAFGAIGRPPQP
jgi:tRNA 2-selenouridine synthase